MTAFDGVLGKHPLQQGRIADITLDERHGCASDALHPLQHRAAAVAQVVQHHERNACLGQRHTGMRANEAGSARYKNHAIALLKNGDLGSEEEIHRTGSTR